MFNWVGALLARWFGYYKVKPNVEFNQRERVDPVLHLVSDNSLRLGDIKMVEDFVYRWSPDGWESVCYLPKQHEVLTPQDLPKMAPFGWRYAIDGRDWTWDGSVWVSNLRSTVNWNRVPNTRVKSVADLPARSVSSQPVIADRSPSSDNMFMGAVMMNEIMSGSSSSTTRHHSSDDYHHSSSSCSSHDSYDSGSSSSDSGSSSCD